MKMIDHFEHHNHKKKKRIVYPLLFVLFSAIIVFNVYHFLTPARKYQVKVVELNKGWGFQIKHKNKVLIDQPFIPARPGKTPFPSKSSARETGKLVSKRLNYKILPLITPEDLVRLKLDTASVKRDDPSINE